ncbi:MAG: rod shape-determining protein MreC [Planctomycetota bacterium]
MAYGDVRISRPALFGILMTVSVVALLLPPRWTTPLKSVAQLLVPAQDVTRSAAYKASQSVERVGQTDSDTGAQLDSLTLELASVAAALEQAHTENDRLRALRRDQVPQQVPVLPARIVARDVVATRDSALIARGSQRGVSAGDWVTARFFIDKGLRAGVEEGQAVLTEHCLLGRVEQVSPYMARVQLFSDLDSPRIEVRVGVMDGKSFRFVDYPCSLRGAGKQSMLIDGVDYRVVNVDGDDAKGTKRRISVGDLVFCAPGQLGLPQPLLIGRVSKMSEDARKRLVYNIEVEPIKATDDLRDVFVIPLVPIMPIPTRDH